MPEARYASCGAAFTALIVAAASVVPTAPEYNSGPTAICDYLTRPAPADPPHREGLANPRSVYRCQLWQYSRSVSSAEWSLSPWSRHWWWYRQASGRSPAERKVWSRRHPPSCPAIVFQVQLGDRDAYPWHVRNASR